jgi:hypothetical protein
VLRQESLMLGLTSNRPEHDQRPCDLLDYTCGRIAVLKADSTVTWTNGHPGWTHPADPIPVPHKIWEIDQSTGETGTGDHQIPSEA